MSQRAKVTLVSPAIQSSDAVSDYVIFVEVGSGLLTVQLTNVAGRLLGSGIQLWNPTGCHRGRAAEP